MTEQEQREAVVAEARTWIGTRYHSNQGVKGAGVDCAFLLLRTWANVGLIEDFDPGYYSRDWHLHRSEEKYAEWIEKYCRRVDNSNDSFNERGRDFHVEPGDIVMVKLGLTHSHAGIVSDWPHVVHANAPARCVTEDTILGSPMAEMPMRVYSFWGRS